MTRISLTEREGSSAVEERAVEAVRVISEDELGAIAGGGRGYNGMVMDDTAGKEGVGTKSAYGRLGV
jgi:hypothetical protein